MFEVIVIVVLLTYSVCSTPEDCGLPPSALVLDQSSCAEFDIGPLHSTTEGSTLKFYCEGLLIRTRAPFDYCPIMVCEETGHWRPAQLSCGGASECYDSSVTYDGRRTCTSSGKLCQRWDSQWPHSHEYTDSDFPHNNMTLSEAYCRDPNGDIGEPWCYTNDADEEWEECDIPVCTDTTIGQGKCQNDYCGDPSMISADNGCVKLNLVTDYTRHVGSAMAYMCKSLLVNFTSAMDYCPIQICQNDFYWSSVNISCGVNECYNPGQSQLYQGRRTCTGTGKRCQRWESMAGYTDGDFPDGSVSGAGFYCRNPGGAKEEPWCYHNTNTQEWEYCGVLRCSILPVDYGTCPAPAPDPEPMPRPPTLPPSPSSTSTTAVPTTTTSTAATTTTDFRGYYDGYSTYFRVKTDLSGFQKQETILAVHSAVECARLCSEYILCDALTFGVGRACSLYLWVEQNYFAEAVPCTILKCFIRDYLTFLL